MRVHVAEDRVKGAGRKAVPGRPFYTLLQYNLPYWRDYLRGAALAVVFVGVGLTVPLVLRAVVDRIERHTMTGGSLLLYFWLLVGVALTTGLARYWQRSWMIGASRKFEYDLRNDYFRHIQRLSRDFFNRTKTGDMMARATNDLNHVRRFIGPGVMNTVDMMRVPLTLAMMIYLSPRLTLIALTPLPVVSLLVYFFVMYMHRQSKKVQEQFSVVTSRAQENLAGARVVKAYGAADRELRDFRAESARYMRENMKLSVVMCVAWPLISFVTGVAVLLVVWQGGSMVIRETLSLADFSGLIIYLLMLIWPLVEFGWVLTLYQRAAVSMNRITEILGEVPTIRDEGHTRADITSVAGAIRFERVCFAYEGGKEDAAPQPILQDLDFEIRHGQSAAIVGPTGSGKSSIIALLTREYDPTTGRILIDGIYAPHIPLRLLRCAIGYGTQETFLFSDTIRANLTLGRPDAGEAAMDRACEVAQFRETVSELPDRYDTLLGERGVNLSGGQKQRLAIARAVLCDPKILILDDAFSSVDTHTEEGILQHLNAVTTTRTSVIISHRVSTVQHAELILVMDEGRVIERGTHDELLKLGGLYAAMYERQLLEEELEKE